MIPSIELSSSDFLQELQPDKKLKSDLWKIQLKVFFAKQEMKARAPECLVRARGYIRGFGEVSWLFLCVGISLFIFVYWYLCLCICALITFVVSERWVAKSWACKWQCIYSYMYVYQLELFHVLMWASEFFLVVNHIYRETGCKMLTLIVLGEPSIDFRCSWFVLSPRRIHGASFSWIFSFFQDNTEPVLLYVEQEGGFCPFLLQMPDDILLLLTRFLSIEDLFRWFLLIGFPLGSNLILSIWTN